MVSFECDYVAGAHPEILKRLVETNLENLPGYGDDHYCESAKEKIRAACGREDADVELLVGGTQTNMTVISTMLKEYEGVIAPDSGHINVHEAGAIEHSGHKVISVPADDGKLKAEDLRGCLKAFWDNPTHPHMVFPGMVYISHPTEYGTLYTLDELREISGICKEHDIYLYIDGARLGYGVMSSDTDVTLKDIAELADVFYIGGTKVGALCGEAVVFTGGCKPDRFMTRIKTRAALLAKGRLLGVQFDTLFTDDLYFKISKHAIDMADRLKEIIRSKGWEFYHETPTNQQFILMNDEQMEKLGKYVRYDIWDKYDDERTIVRLVTSWSTTEEDLDVLESVE